MTKVYVIVIINTGKTRILTLEKKESVFERIVDLEKAEEVRRIFSVDEIGRVQHYDLVLDKRLKLRERGDLV